MPKNYLPQQNTINQYIADGITSIFNYTFLILTDEDIAVYVTNPGEMANPDKDLQILNQDYTVQNAGNETGGTITFVKNKIPVTGSIVTLVRSMQVSIDTEFGNAQTFNGHTLDAAFERVLLIQRVAMLMKNFGHRDPKINSHDATEIRPRFVRRPPHTGPFWAAGSGYHHDSYGVMRFLLRPSTHAYRGLLDSALLSQSFPCLVVCNNFKLN